MESTHLWPGTWQTRTVGSQQDIEVTKKRKIDLKGPGELTHNPFAALRGGAGGTGGDAGEAGESDRCEPIAAAGPGADVPETYPPGWNAGGNVVVRHERKGRGGKTVTIASWRDTDPPAAPDLERLARDLGRRLGSRARVEDGAIVVQGKLVERLARILETEHGARVTRGTA